MKKSILLLGVICLGCSGMDLQAQRKRPPTTSLGLNLDGQYLGAAHSVSGGNIRGEVSKRSLGPAFYQKKHLSTLIQEPMVLTVDWNLDDSFYDWIKGALDGKADPKNLEVLTLDANNAISSSRQHNEATITNVTFPALNGSSKESAYLSVTVNSGQIRYAQGGGNLKSAAKVSSSKWLASKFRVEIGDLPCARVSKVESFSWSVPIVESKMGSRRSASKSQGKPEVSNLKLAISNADLQPWKDWFQEFVINGKASDSDELSGSITFLAPSGQTELASVELENIGLIALQQPAETPTTFEVELYVERMVFQKGE